MGSSHGGGGVGERHHVDEYSSGDVVLLQHAQVHSAYPTAKTILSEQSVGTCRSGMESPPGMLSSESKVDIVLLFDDVLNSHDSEIDRRRIPSAARYYYTEHVIKVERERRRF